MASGLRAKLNALGAAAPAPAKRVHRACGVAFYTDRRPAEPGLFALSPEGLRRVGWTGRALQATRVLFLDTETTGLSTGAGTVAFLVGLGYLDGADFVVDQYLMRDYSDEAEMLSRIAATMERFDCVCSFNGKNFDLPLLETRFTMCRLRNRWRCVDQLDLLYPARRTWKLRIGSCRLSAIEEKILGAPRAGDLPGSEVPQRYFSYLKTGDMALLDDIVAHNRQDIYTLGTLLNRLCAVYAAPERLDAREDVFSVGRALERQGELRPARELYRIAAIPAPAGTIAALTGDRIGAMAAWRAYLLARKNRDGDEAREILERMASRRQNRDRVYEEMAKLYEHHYKNCRRALRYAELALSCADQAHKPAIQKRIARLQTKLQGQR